VVKVIASDVRKGNVLEHEDGKLYVVMSHETFRPGKGTPTTTIDMRRIVDGVKTTETGTRPPTPGKGVRGGGEAHLTCSTTATPAWCS
jgi:hypothetical protein